MKNYCNVLQINGDNCGVQSLLQSVERVKNDRFDLCFAEIARFSTCAVWGVLL